MPCYGGSRIDSTAQLYLRGNVITLDGDESSLADGQSMVEELIGLIENGEDLEPQTVDAVSGAIEGGVEPAAMLGDSVWQHRGTGSRPDPEPGALRRLDPWRTVTFGVGPHRHRKRSSRWRWRSQRSSPVRSAGRCARGRQIEAGDRSTSCPETCGKGRPLPRPLFGRPSTTCSTPTGQRILRWGVIEVAPLAFMRGRTLNDSFIIARQGSGTPAPSR